MENDSKQWYVLRDLKRRNAKMPAYKMLQEAPYSLPQVYTPTRAGQPVLPDLLFVREDRRVLDPIIALTPTLQYRFARGCKYNDPMRVPDRQMNAFMELVSRAEEELRRQTEELRRKHRGRHAQDEDPLDYYLWGEITPDMQGMEVCVTEGPFKGCRGKLLMPGADAAGKKRNKRGHKIFSVAIEGIVLASVSIPSKFLRPAFEAPATTSETPPTPDKQ